MFVPEKEKARVRTNSKVLTRNYKIDESLKGLGKGKTYYIKTIMTMKFIMTLKKDLILKKILV
mgnify:CR=1 FL=1